MKSLIMKKFLLFLLSFIMDPNVTGIELISCLNDFTKILKHEIWVYFIVVTLTEMKFRFR